jgi:hypothetical protein
MNTISSRFVHFEQFLEGKKERMNHGDDEDDNKLNSNNNSYIELNTFFKR